MEKARVMRRNAVSPDERTRNSMKEDDSPDSEVVAKFDAVMRRPATRCESGPGRSSGAGYTSSTRGSSRPRTFSCVSWRLTCTRAKSSSERSMKWAATSTGVSLGQFGPKKSNACPGDGPLLRRFRRRIYAEARSEGWRRVCAHCAKRNRPISERNWLARRSFAPPSCGAALPRTSSP